MATTLELIQALMETLSHAELEQLVREARDKEEASRPPKDWKKEQRECPKCGHKGPVDPDFGVVKQRGQQKPQSWCRSCRATTNYHARPRKYRVGVGG